MASLKDRPRSCLDEPCLVKLAACGRVQGYEKIEVVCDKRCEKNSRKDLR